ncbi:hypothetical protein F4802DRAFT_606232 [Xylaria palmicola]|nr:hypothetical protein F4802DRAFT_606232 [Xylaria palmicola]
MSHHKPHVRSSRRVPPLADKDIDHEISLVDRDVSMNPPDAEPSSPRSNQDSQSSRSSQSSPTANQPASDRLLAHSESQAPLTQAASESGRLSNVEEPEAGPSQIPRIIEHPADDDDSPQDSEGSSGASRSNNPRQQPGRLSVGSRESGGRRPRLKEPETEIDILYENQRGGFLCGIPLFSSAALGNLDPPGWTNFAHKSSPTDIYNAQVPDPSWEWAWPEWRINHDDEIQSDGDGWEYSFMFARKFSWHPPKWYNSFVRRRAWIRRRIRINSGYTAMDDTTMNSAYFTVTAKQQDQSPVVTVSEVERRSMDRQSWRSQRGSRQSRERSRGDTDSSSLPPEVKTAEDLMARLKQLRIDREKLEVVENYINNCTDDLLPLQDYMHDIMAAFVFQASRKTLLSRLTQLHDNGDMVGNNAHKGKSTAAASMAENLAEAIKHADEEVRRLEYWSDIKGMAENGEAARAVDQRNGWDKGWQGLDRSGAKGINEDKIRR